MNTTKPYLFVVAVLLLTACKLNEPEDMPTALFTLTQKDLTVSFTNASRNAQSFVWDFGDGKTSTDKNPVHKYSKYGTFKVTLTAKNGLKTHTISQDITLIRSNPKAEFTFETIQPMKVVLSNKSVNATSYFWDFGDGTSSTQKDPTHRYSGIGVYRVTLTAKNGNLSDIYQANVEIKAPSYCILSGCTIFRIPTNNRYYQIQVTDDYILSKTTYLWTSWFILSSANLPYDYMLKSPKTLNINNDYVIRLYKYTGSGNPSDTQASGKGDWSALISSSKLKAYPETLYFSNNNAAVTVIFDWL